MMYLNQAQKEKTYRIISFASMPLALERRLESLGMTPGTEVDVLNTKSHGTCILRVRESRYALARTISACVCVEEVDAKPFLPVDAARRGTRALRDTRASRKRTLGQEKGRL